MKTLNHIPTSRLERTGKLLKTGAKIGINYLKYYTNKLTEDEEKSREKLNRDNADDIYDSLKKLKGSALKVAQMLSMEKDLMPLAYVEKFSLSQFSVPPLSGALVRKTFRKYFGKNPEEIFDKFGSEAVNAASIGQVHKAWKDGKELAVKIQYPGVKDSIASDLKMVKPIAMKMFNIQKEGSDKYFKEVENKLYEETDYDLELKRSQTFCDECRHLPNIMFPHYYPEYSCNRILTMDWMEGVHFPLYLKKNPTQTERNQLGQTLWDFYMYQLHVLHKLHADPHPGNFLVSDQNALIVIDFGCIKEIPTDFYKVYQELISGEDLDNPEKFENLLNRLEFLNEEDSEEERVFFIQLLHEMFSLITLPFRSEVFDFSNEEFFQSIAALGRRYANLNDIRKVNTNRGSKHFIYINRTFFGLFNLMHNLSAQGIQVNHYKDLIKG